MLVKQPDVKPSDRRGQIVLSPAPLLLTVITPEPEELDELAEDLKLSTVTKYHRLPPLTYLRFDFENRTALPWQLHLTKTRFVAGNRVFGVVSADEYGKRFTSISYEHFRYDAIYAAYITKRRGQKPEDKFWFEKKLPHEVIEVGSQEAGFQILPFEFIPPGIEELTLHYTIEPNKEKKLSLQLVTERGN